MLIFYINIGSVFIYFEILEMEDLGIFIPLLNVDSADKDNISKQLNYIEDNSAFVLLRDIIYSVYDYSGDSEATNTVLQLFTNGVNNKDLTVDDIYRVLTTTHVD